MTHILQRKDADTGSRVGQGQVGQGQPSRPDVELKITTDTSRWLGIGTVGVGAGLERGIEVGTLSATAMPNT